MFIRSVGAHGSLRPLVIFQERHMLCVNVNVFTLCTAKLPFRRHMLSRVFADLPCQSLLQFGMSPVTLLGIIQEMLSIHFVTLPVGTVPQLFSLICACHWKLVWTYLDARKNSSSAHVQLHVKSSILSIMSWLTNCGFTDTYLSKRSFNVMKHVIMSLDT